MNNRSLFLVPARENAAAAERVESTSKVVAIGSSGELVLVGGNYAVYHEQHNLPESVTVLEGERFPKCEACEETVSFDLLEALPGLTRSQHPIVLNKLPVMPAEDEESGGLRRAS